METKNTLLYTRYPLENTYVFPCACVYAENSVAVPGVSAGVEVRGRCIGIVRALGSHVASVYIGTCDLCHEEHLVTVVSRQSLGDNDAYRSIFDFFANVARMIILPGVSVKLDIDMPNHRSDVSIMGERTQVDMNVNLGAVSGDGDYASHVAISLVTRYARGAFLRK